MIERQLSRKILYRGGFLDFVEDEIIVEFSETHLEPYKSKRQFVIHGGGVCIIPVLPSGELLMVKQFRTPVGEVLYEFPAGKIEADEDPFLTAKRELEEETGYRASEWKELNTLYPSPGYSSERQYFYLAKDLEEGESSPDPGEFLEIVSLSFEEAMEKIGSNEIKDSKTINGLFFLSNFAE